MANPDIYQESMKGHLSTNDLEELYDKFRVSSAVRLYRSWLSISDVSNSR